MRYIGTELGRRLGYAIAGHRASEAVDLSGLVPVLPWRRYAKFGLGAVFLAVGALTAYQQVIVQVSREAVINARIATVRAPLDGIVKTAAVAPGRAMQAAAPIRDIEDPAADDARVFQLQQDMHATGP